jgi:hypothetical protein
VVVYVAAGHETKVNYDEDLVYRYCNPRIPIITLSECGTPANQIAAAALITKLTLVLGDCFGEEIIHPNPSNGITLIDENTAEVHFDRGTDPRIRDASGRVMWTYDLTVVKQSDCLFEISEKGQKIGEINLGVLSSEYTQYHRGDANTLFTIRGNGKAPAFCTRTMPPPVGGCFKDLPLGPGSAPIWNDRALRALRAVQFLQQRCPPQTLPF